MITFLSLYRVKQASKMIAESKVKSKGDILNKIQCKKGIPNMKNIQAITKCKIRKIPKHRTKIQEKELSNSLARAVEQSFIPILPNLGSFVLQQMQQYANIIERKRGQFFQVQPNTIYWLTNGKITVISDNQINQKNQKEVQIKHNYVFMMPQSKRKNGQQIIKVQNKIKICNNNKQLKCMSMNKQIIQYFCECHLLLNLFEQFTQNFEKLIANYSKKGRSYSENKFNSKVQHQKDAPFQFRKRYLTHWSKKKSQSIEIKQQNHKAFSKFKQSMQNRYKKKQQFERKYKKSVTGKIYGEKNKRLINDPIFYIPKINRNTFYRKKKIDSTYKSAIQSRNRSRQNLTYQLNDTLQQVTLALFRTFNVMKQQ